MLVICSPPFVRPFFWFSSCPSAVPPFVTLSWSQTCKILLRFALSRSRRTMRRPDWSYILHTCCSLVNLAEGLPCSRFSCEAGSKLHSLLITAFGSNLWQDAESFKLMFACSREAQRTKEWLYATLFCSLNKLACSVGRNHNYTETSFSPPGFQDCGWITSSNTQHFISCRFDYFEVSADKAWKDFDIYYN